MSTPLDRKSKKPRSETKIAYAEAQTIVEERKMLADARAAKAAAAQLPKPKTMEEARLARIEKAKGLQEEKRRIEAKKKAKEVDLTSQSTQGPTEKEAVLEPQEGEPKKQHQEEDEERLKNIQMDSTPPSPSSIPHAPHGSPKSPAPPVSQHAPSSPQWQAKSTEETPSQPQDTEEVPTKGKNQDPSASASTSNIATLNTLNALQEELKQEKLQRQLNVSRMMAQTATHDAKVMDSQKDTQESNEFSIPYAPTIGSRSLSTPPSSIGGVPILTSHFLMPPFVGPSFHLQPFHNPRVLLSKRTPLTTQKSPTLDTPQGHLLSIETHVPSQLLVTQDSSNFTQPSRVEKLRVTRSGRCILEVNEGLTKGPTKKKSKTITKDITGEAIRREHWKEHWIIQLIHVRCGMNNEFTRAHKQGVDLWSKVSIQLASLYSDCDKDEESCRKRWGRIYDSYKKDKLYLSILGNDRKISCQWFDIVDQYMSDRATVTIDAFESAHTLGEDIAETNEDI
ncbi:hypothetical protein L7F22_014372 [Adiantum nelumboides]|nr:hypothetical protein [Adiantum nelumboides]